MKFSRNSIKIGKDIEGKTYRDRELQLKLLGYTSYTSYLNDIYWPVIRGEVLRRDDWKCRVSSSRCKGGKNPQVHHLSYSRAVLMGINLGCLVTLCRDCHEYCEISKTGAKYSLYEAQQRTFELLIGERKRVGTSSKRIGNWFRNEYVSNRFYSQNILFHYSESKLPWFNLILSDLVDGSLPTNFIEYLDIHPRVFERMERYRPMAGRTEWSRYIAMERKLKRNKQEGLDKAAKQASEALEGFTKRLQKRKKFWSEGK